MKKPLSVRNKFPFESKAVTQITEGRTLASRFPNSVGGVWPGLDLWECLFGGVVGDCGVLVAGGGDCVCCASKESARTVALHTVIKTVIPSAYRREKQL